MTLRAAGAICGRYGGRFCKEVALQRIRAQLDDLAQLGGGLHALGNDLHAARVGEGLQRFEEGQPLDFIQCALLLRQLHDGSG